MRDRIFTLRLLVAVARAGGFSPAARELGISQPTASRMIAALEEEIGTALFTRTTRALSLSSAGAEYLARIEPILSALEEADHAARGATQVRGTLRVALPHSIAVREIIPRLPRLLARHPRLELDLTMADRFQDLVRDRVDVALRVGPLASSSATARRLASIPRVVVVAPSYLQRSGTPASPAELSQHRAVTGPVNASPAAWTFRRGHRTVVARVSGQVRTNAADGGVAAAVAGLGILSTGLWGCRAELAQGSLLRLFTDWSLEPADLHAVFPAGRSSPPSARAFVDFLVGELAGVG